MNIKSTLVMIFLLLIGCASSAAQFPDRNAKDEILSNWESISRSLALKATNDCKWQLDKKSLLNVYEVKDKQKAYFNKEYKLGNKFEKIYRLALSNYCNVDDESAVNAILIRKDHIYSVIEVSVIIE